MDKKKNVEDIKKDGTKKKKTSTKTKRIIKKDNIPFFKTSDTLGLVIITCIVSLFMGYFFGTKITAKQVDKEMENAMDKISSAFQDIKDNYYEEVDDDTLVDGAINGMMAALGDPYASYYTDDESNSFDIELNGSYEGIGIEVFNNEENEIEILTVFENSPASEAGLKAGDIVTALNDKNARKKSTQNLVNQIAKLEDETFTLTILREGEEKKLEVNRDYIEISSVSSQVYERNNKKIGYVSVSIFSMKTYEQFKNQLEKLEGENIQSLIIDVRGNSGGHLTTVEDMLSLFLDNSHVIYQIQTKEKTEKYRSTGKVTKKYPIVILTDGSSASASELLTIALKEEYGAISIGTKTYGKGTVQELKNIDGGEYKFTTKKWLSPKGNWINDKGIEPDIEVTLDETYYSNPSAETDAQLQKALEYLSE